MTILGIDPGTTTVGYGIVKKEKDKLHCVEYGAITSSMKENRAKFLNIYKNINELIKKHKPDIVVVEKLFFFKNLKTVISVSEARGVILLTISLKKIGLQEYTPLQIKQAITGYGRANKKQIQKMVKIIFNLKEVPKPDDAADALAIAICAANSTKLGIN